MKVKLTTTIEEDVKGSLDSHFEYGYKSAAEMVEAAVRRLTGEERPPAYDAATIQGMVEEYCGKWFGVERQNLAVLIKNDVLEAIADRLQPAAEVQPEDSKYVIGWDPAGKF